MALNINNLTHREFKLDVEFNALGEREIGAIIYCIGLSAHIGFPGIGARFPSTTGFFFTTEGTTDLSTGSTNIYVGDSAVTPSC